MNKGGKKKNTLATNQWRLDEIEQAIATLSLQSPSCAREIIRVFINFRSFGNFQNMENITQNKWGNEFSYFIPSSLIFLFLIEGVQSITELK